MFREEHRLGTSSKCCSKCMLRMDFSECAFRASKLWVHFLRPVRLLNRCTACGVLFSMDALQAFINTAAKIYQKIEEGIFDVSNEVHYQFSELQYISLQNSSLHNSIGVICWFVAVISGQWSNFPAQNHRCRPVCTFLFDNKRLIFKNSKTKEDEEEEKTDFRVRGTHELIYCLWLKPNTPPPNSEQKRHGTVTTQFWPGRSSIVQTLLVGRGDVAERVACSEVVEQPAKARKRHNLG